MKSATAISYELDDISAATKELTVQIRDKFFFRKQLLGQIFCKLRKSFQKNNQ